MFAIVAIQADKIEIFSEKSRRAKPLGIQPSCAKSLCNVPKIYKTFDIPFHFIAFRNQIVSRSLSFSHRIY